MSNESKGEKTKASVQMSIEDVKENGCKESVPYEPYVDETPNDLVEFPYGLFRTLKHYLDYVGVSRYLRKLKKSAKNAPRLDLIILAMMTFSMSHSNSMDACSRWLEDRQMRDEIGFRRKDVIDQKTICRAIDKLGENREGVLECLWAGLKERYKLNDFDIAVDGSAVVVYGPKSNLGRYGHPRDGGPGDLQVEFTVAILTQLGIPVYIRQFKGNTSDEEQYREAIPEISALVQGKGIRQLDEYKAQGIELEAMASLIKIGTTIIADNGAASNENMERASKCGNEVVVRVRVNDSDVKNVSEHCDKFVLLEDLGVLCYHHTFGSGKNIYLFFSPDLLKAAINKARNSIDRAIKIYLDFLKHGMNKSKVLKVKKIPGVDVKTEVTIYDIDIYEYKVDKYKKAREKVGIRAGLFKLQTTENLPPEEVLRRYRQRGLVEQTISSLKNVTGIKPLRVWTESSIEGSMVLALLSEAAISMARYEIRDTYKNLDLRSGSKKKEYQPSTRAISMQLSHLTLVRSRTKGGRKNVPLANWTPLVKAIFDNIHSHESQSWGSIKPSVALRGYRWPRKGQSVNYPSSNNSGRSGYYCLHPTVLSCF